MNRFAVAIMGPAMFAGAAWSQATAPVPPVQYLAVKPDAMMSSHIVGLKVYSPTNENIAEIADIVIDRDALSGFVLSVGGFLGMGERYVAVEPSSIKISYDSSAKKWKASANATKDQLKSAPEFKYEDLSPGAALTGALTKPATPSGEKAGQKARVTAETTEASREQTAPSPPVQQAVPKGEPAVQEQAPPRQALAPADKEEVQTGRSAVGGLSPDQQAKLRESVSNIRAARIVRVEFPLTVGTIVPRDVRLSALPSRVVQIIPRYKGYKFFMHAGDIVIVDPVTSRIVAVIPA